MEHFERNQLIPLRDALNSLMKFVREIPSVGIPQFYCFLDYMKNNIEIYLYAPMDANEWETLFLRLKDILIRDWREANHSVWGIPAFDLLIGERENKTELCLEFLQLVSVIDGFFLKIILLSYLIYGKINCRFYDSRRQLWRTKLFQKTL